MPTTLAAAELVEVVAARALEIADKGKATPIILIDGRSGSGKTTFAKTLQNLLFQGGESAPRIISMDSLYDGWQGLDAGADYLLRFVLNAVALGKTASWQEYDWAAAARSGTWREFEGGTPLIVEGCGALSVASAQVADLAIWLECDSAVRRQRWNDREPVEHEPYWAVWAAQEEAFYAREKSPELAEFVGLSN